MKTGITKWLWQWQDRAGNKAVTQPFFVTVGATTSATTTTQSKPSVQGVTDEIASPAATVATESSKPEVLKTPIEDVEVASTKDSSLPMLPIAAGTIAVICVGVLFLLHKKK